MYLVIIDALKNEITNYCKHVDNFHFSKVTIYYTLCKNYFTILIELPISQRQLGMIDFCLIIFLEIELGLKSKLNNPRE